MLFLASAIRALLSFSSFLPVALAKRAKACWKSGRQRQLSWFQNLRIPHAQTHMNYHEFISSTRIECRMSIYLAKKVPIYRRFAFRKQSHPIRCSETFRNQRWTVDAQSNHRSMLRLFGGFQKYFWSKFQGYIHRHPISHDAGLRTLCKNHHNLSWLQGLSRNWAPASRDWKGELRGDGCRLKKESSTVGGTRKRRVPWVPWSNLGFSGTIRLSAHSSAFRGARLRSTSPCLDRRYRSRQMGLSENRVYSQL